MGHMIHANRFGEFGERCAGGVYLSGVWVEWLHLRSTVRNQLSCYLRSVIGIIEICKFLWCGAALIGLHLTMPFMSMLLDHRVTPNQLLQILPALYQDLLTYPNDLTSLDFGSCLPSLKSYWLDPFDQKTSPYGVDVCKAIKDYISGCDREIMSTYLKQICYQAAVVLKRQRGDQYGFGDNPDSPQHISKNMSQNMLNDPNATHTKAIENFFGNLDGRLKNSGARGFKKSVDDLIIKYSKDLVITGEHHWRMKRNKDVAAELHLKTSKFEEEQKKLLKSVSQQEADLLCEENKVVKVLTKCKASHGGPLTSLEELQDLVNNWPAGPESEKSLHTALNLEIRFRKLTVTTVKGDCSLFKQRNLAISEKVANLTSLISSQLKFSATADMDDLEAAIISYQGESIAPVSVEDLPVTEPNPSAVEEQLEPLQPPSFCHLNSDQNLCNDTDESWPPKKNDCVVGLFEDTFYPGEVLSVNGDSATITFMSPVKGSKRYWIWPSRKDTQTLERPSILKVRPRLEVSRMSTVRVVVFDLINHEIVNKFSEI